jgi:hypothetical protein
MTNRIILLSLLASLLISFVSGENCDQKQISYYVNTSQFENAAVCLEANKDYNNAIAYYLKHIESIEKLGRNDTALVHIMIAECYSKKGKGFDQEIKEQCALAEPLLLNKISDYQNSDKPLYGAIYSAYGSLADCYKLIKSNEKSCEYCLKENEYKKKAGRGDLSTDCVRLYDCLKPSPDLTTSGTPSKPSEGFPMIYLVLGGAILLIILAALFLSKKKK